MLDYDVPDPDPQIGEASKEAIQLGREQFELQKGLLEKYTPMYEQQMAASLEAQTKNTARSDAMWKQYEDIFAPANAQLAKTAMGYDTESRRASAAGEAESAVADQFATQRQGMAEQLNAAGIDPASGVRTASGNAMGIAEAKARAGASTAARRGVEATGLQLLSGAVNAGNGLPSQGLQTGQAGLMAGGNATGQVAGLSGLSAQGLNSALAGYSTGIGGLQGLYNAQANAASQKAGVIGDLIGAGAGAAGMYFSDENKKHMGPKVSGASDAVKQSPSKHWQYKDGEGDGDTKPRMGPTAQSLRDATGGVVSDGSKVDGIAMLGLHHAAIAEQGKKLDKLSKDVRGLAIAVRSKTKEVA
jgi:hypothetical protein